MPNPKPKTITTPALEIRQGPKRKIYSFAIDGKQLPHFATVSRIKRATSSDVFGYQRPEVVSHIREIQTYLESDSPMIPNSIVLAFDKRVKFVPLDAKQKGGEARLGHLVIPVVDGEEHEKPGWIVDGQQRVAAVSRADIKRFPLSAVAFIAGNDEEQREQFILVNSTKPLPKGLIYELIPHTNARLPSLLERRRFPAFLLQRLNHDEDSPLLNLIQTPTSPEGIIKDNSILKMLENSLEDGALYRFRDPSTGEGDVDEMLTVLKNFWTAVSEVFSQAWAMPPRKSRLMHGAGIVSLGFIMDAIADRMRDIAIPAAGAFAEDLAPLAGVCSWTSGYWTFGSDSQMRWNELQNTSKHIQILTNFLIFKYKSLVWSAKT